MRRNSHFQTFHLILTSFIQDFESTVQEFCDNTRCQIFKNCLEVNQIFLDQVTGRPLNRFFFLKKFQFSKTLRDKCYRRIENCSTLNNVVFLNNSHQKDFFVENKHKQVDARNSCTGSFVILLPLSQLRGTYFLSVFQAFSQVNISLVTNYRFKTRIGAKTREH